MISYLEGKVILKKDKAITLGVGGVGFKIFLSQKSLLKIPEIGQNLKLFCFLDVKENGLNLYGFLNSAELDFFETLNNIHGIGPKAAIEISALGSLEKIKERILAQDENLFSGIPGIGKKKAMAIILELTGKIKNISDSRKTEDNEAESALLGLGFSRQEIKSALEKISKDIKNPEQKVKEALKILGRK